MTKDAMKCRRCGVPIQFIATPTGSQMPCDMKRLSIVTDEGRVVQGYNPHWASCPAARSFRKVPAGKKDPKEEQVDPEDARAQFRELRASLEDETNEPEEEL